MDGLYDDVSKSVTTYYIHKAKSTSKDFPLRLHVDDRWSATAFHLFVISFSISSVKPSEGIEPIKAAALALRSPCRIPTRGRSQTMLTRRGR